MLIKTQKLKSHSCRNLNVSWTPWLNNTRAGGVGPLGWARALPPPCFHVLWQGDVRMRTGGCGRRTKRHGQPQWQAARPVCVCVCAAPHHPHVDLPLLRLKRLLVGRLLRVTSRLLVVALLLRVIHPDLLLLANLLLVRISLLLMAAAGLLMLLRVRSGRGLERNAAMPLRIHGDRGAATWCRGGRRAGEAWVTVCVHHVAMTLSPPGKWQQHAHCNCAIFKMADSQRGHFFPGLQTTAVSPFMVAAKPRHVTSGAPKIRYSQCGGDRVRRQGKGFCVWWRNETGDPGALAAGGGFRSCPRAA